MQLADEWQRLLDTGEVRNRAELARRVGVSGMWITNVLALLNLHPEIQAWVRGLPPGTPERFVTERALRAIARLPLGLQVGAARNRRQRRPGTSVENRRAAEVRPVMIVEEAARADRNRAATHSHPTGASIPAGGILTSMAQPKHMPEPVPAALKPLVDQLAKLTGEQRRLVVEAAEQSVEPREFVGLSEQDIQRLTGVVAIGGNALDDCDALYDG